MSDGPKQTDLLWTGIIMLLLWAGSIYGLAVNNGADTSFGWACFAYFIFGGATGGWCLWMYLDPL